MKQTVFNFYDVTKSRSENILTNFSFSHNEICDEQERKNIEFEYQHILEETTKFNRQTVSFQANKTETLHSWIKYREGFSAQLVETLISDLGVKQGQTILDPFAGSCTTLLVAKMVGINSVGIELLPHCHLAWDAKSRVFDFNISELKDLYQQINNSVPTAPNESFPHLTITESAFPEENERDLMAYAQWVENLNLSPNTRILLKAALMSILEDISYTRKDGQYLRWDVRAEKIVNRNKIRISQGKKSIKGIDKGDLPKVKDILVKTLLKIIHDVQEMQNQTPPESKHNLLKGNVLYTLPTLEENQFSAVITSPPYANRYDYTRTYALELAFLNVGDEIFSLRQEMLSCTVENRPKYILLEEFYASLGRPSNYHDVVKILDLTPVLKEINSALELRNERGDINNKGVLSMIEQYFAELTFVYYELFRTCKSGAHIAFVNDNVRYAGEVIPVDLISTKLAETIGFIPVKVYVLPQRKGNSSQQMGKFGRRELRKSITIWRKP
ncbi:modification methylase [bacterium]|nr:modification methylase [bacterium]